MPNISKTVSRLEKRVKAVENRQTQNDSKIIPLIVKQYQTLKVSPLYTSTTTYASPTTLACGRSDEVAQDLTERANYIAVGTGSTATIGQRLDSEVFRKLTFSGDSYDNILVIDGIIDTQEANGYTFTNSALMLNAFSTSSSGNIIAGNNAIEISKKSNSTLTISTEITITEV